jgi:hypothetical protein
LTVGAVSSVRATSAPAVANGFCRAAELSEIDHQPRVAVHVYDARAAVQVRLVEQG